LKNDVVPRFKLANHLYVLQGRRGDVLEKFVLWRGKVIHFGKKIEFMELPLLKEAQINIITSSLNLGNSEVCLFGRKFLIHRSGKRRYFKGEM